jgi:hypothetical protein
MATQHLNQVTLTSLATHPSRDLSTISFGINAKYIGCVENKNEEKPKTSQHRKTDETPERPVIKRK